MITKIQKWGNSLGLRIPKSFAEEVRAKPGSKVDLTIQQGRLVVRTILAKKYTLRSLVSGITSHNRHAEIEPAGRLGQELL